jgi:hypothetical protein
MSVGKQAYKYVRYASRTYLINETDLRPRGFSRFKFKNQLRRLIGG